MTEIAFYSAVLNPIGSTAKLIAKIVAQQRRVRVLTPDAAATAELGRLLWESPAEGFIPHVTLASPHVAHTPVVIDHAATHEGTADVLINLGLTPPPFFARFERLFEIIGQDEGLANAGRERWKFYKERGYALTHTVMRT
ncbi:MAG: DNA polymerase III subunit chi [Burkholderiales bacterium]|nr:DNA polymerase III subunit chi [Burkholderiales bacterium]